MIIIRSRGVRILKQDLLATPGRISWSTSEQVAVPGARKMIYSIPCIAVDTEGYPWTGYRKVIGPANTRPVVTKSRRAYGIWEADAP